MSLVVAARLKNLALAAMLAAFVGVHEPVAMFAQGTTPETPGTRPMTVSGSLRTRVESWDWFGSDPAGTYTYPALLFRLALAQSKATHDWQVELAVPVLMGLPPQPTGGGPRGLGANYFNANEGRTTASTVFAKQAFLRLKDVAGLKGQSLKVGRMELFDGTELPPKRATLAALKRDRLAQRLLGTFAFTHVGRSFDGVQYALDRPSLNVTAFGGRPTRGVFQVDGWGELNVNVFYAALTSSLGTVSNGGEWRLFGLGYNDYRSQVAKVDNRALATRQVDRSRIDVGTLGGHYIRAVDTSAGTIDVLLWGAAQVGSWGQLTHRAGAFAAEAGWQPRVADLGLWIRGGLNYGSGDDDPDDDRHGTFFQLLTTPRVYARFPFFNMMNSVDSFGELVLRPSPAVTVRTDVHLLRLASGRDLWYQGGGAFQTTTFGYVGLPSHGRRDLATLYDLSVDVAVHPRLSIGAYYGYAAGGLVPNAIEASKADAAFGYLELMVRF